MIRRVALVATMWLGCAAASSPPPPAAAISNEAPDPCAVVSGPHERYARVRIADAGQLISTPSFRNDADATDRLRAAGIPESEFETVFTRIEESGWPPTLSSFQERISHPDIVASICPRQLSAEPDRNGNVLLIVVAAENQHLPSGWRPDVDIYMTFVADGLRPR